MGKKFTIKTTVDFVYESDHNEFDSAEAAEQFGYNFDDMMYDGVFDIVVEEDETCDECELGIGNCSCEENEEEGEDG
jgi:hypothetical protein